MSSEPSFNNTRYEPSLRELNILLQRLERNIASPEAESDFLRSSVQRSKVSFSVNYARTLLHRLTHDAHGSQLSTKGARTQPSLQSQHDTVKKLEDRLFELDQRGDDDGSTDSEGDEEPGDPDTEELLSRYAPAVRGTQDGLNTNVQGTRKGEGPEGTAVQAASALQSILRSRRGGQEQGINNTRTTGHASAQAAQFNTSASSPSKGTTANQRSDNENLLSHHSGEQEDLSDALLSLATALKTSTVSFSDSLAASNPLVDQATGALDNSAGGMEAAQKRMGLLRRMTEGKGRLGRIILYLWVGGLWIALILVMFVMPKLRF